VNSDHPWKLKRRAVARLQKIKRARIIKSTTKENTSQPVRTCIVITSQMRILFLIEAWEFDENQTKLDVARRVCKMMNLLTKDCRRGIRQIVIGDMLTGFESNLFFPGFGFRESPGAKGGIQPD